MQSNLRQTHYDNFAPAKVPTPPKAPHVPTPPPPSLAEELETEFQLSPTPPPAQDQWVPSARDSQWGLQNVQGGRQRQSQLFPALATARGGPADISSPRTQRGVVQRNSHIVSSPSKPKLQHSPRKVGSMMLPRRAKGPLTDPASSPRLNRHSSPPGRQHRKSTR